MRVTCGTRTLVAKSCAHCGHLVMAQHFPMMAGGYRTSHCNKCKNELSKPQVRGQQQRSHRVAVRHRQPWTEQDITKLEEMALDGLTGPEIALKLNRTVYAIYTKLNRLKEKDEAHSLHV